MVVPDYVREYKTCHKNIMRLLVDGCGLMLELAASLGYEVSMDSFGTSSLSREQSIIINNKISFIQLSPSPSSSRLCGSLSISAISTAANKFDAATDLPFLCWKHGGVIFN